MILFLASDEASFVAAGTYMADGGMAASLAALDSLSRGHPQFGQRTRRIL